MRPIVTEMTSEIQTGRTNAGYYVIACIDILGQRDELARIRLAAERNRSKPTPVQDLVRACCWRLSLIRKLFSEGCQVHKTRPPSGFLLSPEQQAELDAVNSFEPAKFQGFGDTVIAYAPVKTYDGDLTIQPVDAFLGGCAMVMLTCLGERIPIRGAIDVDFGFDCFDGEIYGPALQTVNRLESEVAEYPRIVVGNGLLGYLSRFASAHSDGRLADRYSEEIAASCGRLIAQDLDGVSIVDYAGAPCRSRLDRWKDLDSALQKVREFAHQEHMSRVSIGDRKLSLRYALLEGYIAARMKACP